MLGWQKQAKHDPLLRGHLPLTPTPQQNAAIKSWNVMGGRIDWEALPLMVEMFGVMDVTQFVRDLVTIRESMRES